MRRTRPPDESPLPAWAVGRGGMYQDLPVVALPANTVSGAREMFRSEGFTEFVPKPIDRTVLERVLRKVLPKSCIQYGAKPAAAPAVPPPGGTGGAPMSAASAENPEPASVPEVPADGSSLPYDRLIQAGIDVELGLDYCGGEEDFYREMLQIFRTQSGEKRAEIVSLFECANWPDYAIKVHALKSTALTIGAEALSAQAKELELAGKRGDADFILAHHSALLNAYDKLCARIAGI